MTDKHPPELVEAVARAMWMEESFRARGAARLVAWTEESERTRDTWRSAAQAALTAHAEWMEAAGMVCVPAVPSEGMLGAGEHALGEAANEGEDDAHYCYTAMIAAAKGEG